MCACLQASNLGLAIFDKVANEVAVLQTVEETHGPFAFQVATITKAWRSATQTAAAVATL